MIKRILALALATTILTVGHLASAVDRTEWTKLLNATISHGERSNVADFVSFHFKKGTSLDRSQDRTVEYFTVFAQEDMVGNLYPFQGSTVEETWTRINGKWQVSQLIRAVSREGELNKVLQSAYLINDSGIVEQAQTAQLDSADGKQLEQFEAKIREWIEFSQK
jgi:hypothetical protein